MTTVVIFTMIPVAGPTAYLVFEGDLSKFNDVCVGDQGSELEDEFSDVYNSNDYEQLDEFPIELVRDLDTKVISVHWIA